MSFRTVSWLTSTTRAICRSDIPRAARRAYHQTTQKQAHFSRSKLARMLKWLAHCQPSWVYHFCSGGVILTRCSRSFSLRPLLLLAK